MEKISAKPITVITLEDHYLTREGIRSLLANCPDIDLVGEGSAAEHLAPLVEENRPDIVLLDLNLPQKENDTVRLPGNSFRAIPAINWITKHYPKTGLIIVSQYISPAFIDSALVSGVKGYLLKDDALIQYLPEAIRAVYKGGHYFSEEASLQLRSAQPASNLLTRRQREIIRSIATEPDLQLASHASRLGISEHTLSNHLRHIYERLEVRNLSAALVKAIRMGIVSIAFVDSGYQDSVSNSN